MHTTHIAWVTTPASETPQRVELHAADTASALRQALAGAPCGARASCRPVDHSGYILSQLATLASPFPLLVAA